MCKNEQSVYCYKTYSISIEKHRDKRILNDYHFRDRAVLRKVDIGTCAAEENSLNV